ncbi:E3 ubiquitin-protein ligase rnf146 isoform X1 [Ostrinia furnacalis]|uniref:E3 ubiquitin-protein ligase rnf146 isoform X1 n=2 Tax=Ostrinia furnacalis TaxID=93504 RepID=UPI00103F81F2|nr:E3 ubiquitin-protein ligase rnf146 isoform X1 [Ostrinia furnacalis]
MNIDIQEQDCAVCLQKCHHPTQLPCGHIFCFLCVKGVAIQNKNCAMCRAQIPADYLDHPVLLEKNSQQQSADENESVENQWYYEGRNGWWKYDERSNNELESAFSAGDTNCALLLAGAVYTIDFQSMIQFRRNDPTRRRRVRRDTPTLPAKGVAGIKNIGNSNSEQMKTNDEDNGNDEVIIVEAPENEVIIIEDEDQINESDNLDESLEIVHALSTIHLVDPESPSNVGNDSADDT